MREVWKSVREKVMGSTMRKSKDRLSAICYSIARDQDEREDLPVSLPAGLEDLRRTEKANADRSAGES
jgi:hypothetical protein